MRMLSPEVHRPDDRGMMSMEMVILAPILIMFVLLVVFFGRYVAVRGTVEAATRDGVRAASFERDPGTAATAARQAANAAVNGKWTCQPTALTGNFAPGQIIRLDLECDVPLRNLGLLGLRGTMTVRASSQAPLDLYRRVG